MRDVKKFWVLAAVFGAVAAVLAYLYLEAVKEKYEPDDLRPVVKAIVDIPQDSMVTLEQVAVEQVPAKFAHPDAARSTSQVVGKITPNFIASGQEILVKSLVGEEKRLTRLAYAVPVGKRAVSVQVDDVSGVSGMLRPGDRVDVLGTFDVPGGAGQPFSGTTIFLQNIEVLAVGQSLSDAAPAEGGGAGGKYGTVTLAVTPADARPLTLVSERARIRLALRSPVDEGRAVVSPFEMRMLIGR